ncbi:hypothetical protein GGI42DRAFT_323402 [Trichoderma sp. SZMC 28013]
MITQAHYHTNPALSPSSSHSYPSQPAPKTQSYSQKSSPVIFLSFWALCFIILAACLKNAIPLSEFLLSLLLFFFLLCMLFMSLFALKIFTP